MRQHLKRYLSKKSKEFCEHSTLHGAYYLQGHGIGACAAWAGIMVAGFALCAVLSHMIWVKYNVDPTVTVVESTFYRSERIPFPAVLVCDPQPVYGPNTNQISRILSSRGYNESEMDDFYGSLLEIRDRAYVPPMHVRKMHYLLEDLGFSLEVLYEVFKKPCDVIMVKCKWRSKTYNCSDMFTEVVTVKGHCCLFTIAYFRRFVPSNTTLTPGKVPSEALELTVNGVKIYPNGTTSDGSVLLYIFDANRVVTMMDSSISLASSSYFDVDLEIFSIDSSDDVNALPLKTRKCVLPTDKGLAASDYQNCVATLLLRKVTDYCKCLPFMYSAQDLSVENYAVCTWERYLCINSQIEKTLVDMHSLIQSNDCYQNCDYVEYQSKVDYIKKQIRKQTTSRLSIHYASSTCMKYRREMIYTWDQMLANLGGIFGLCLGGSLISIIEIVWFLIDLFVTTICTFTRKIKLEPTEKKVAFVTVKDDAKWQDKRRNGYYNYVN